jgi:hypothetical protein
MPHATPLSISALRLKNLDPRAFDAFVADAEAHSATVTLAVTEAPQHEILVAQGRAQAWRSLVRTLKECHLPHNSKPAP